MFTPTPPISEDIVSCQQDPWKNGATVSEFCLQQYALMDLLNVNCFNAIYFFIIVTVI